MLKPFLCFYCRHTILPTGSMKILDIRVTDAGTYTCVATNIAGNVTQMVTLNVYGKYLFICLIYSVI